MNFLIILLNCIYLFLTKVKNQSPFFGSVIFVTILISFSFLNIIGLYYMFKIESFRINIPLFLVLNIFIFIILYFYASKNKVLITERAISSVKINILVLIFILFTIMSTLYLANNNRSKMPSEKVKKISDKPHKQSLESKIKKWFK